MKLLRKEMLATTLAAMLAGIGGCQDGASPEAVSAARDGLTTSGVDVNLVVQNKWNNGYCVNVNLTNGQASAVTNWSVVITLNQSTVSSLWNGNYTSSAGRITVTPAWYNPQIGPGATVSFGFCGNATGGNFMPSLVSAVITRGVNGSGGAPSTGGAPATGGIESTGGSMQSGGSVSTGGAPATGGIESTGGSTQSSGGSVSTGGATQTGGSPGAGGGTGTCTDTPRPSETCANAKSWGFCGQSWFAGYCSRTCGICRPGSGGTTGAGGSTSTCTDVPRSSESCADAKNWGFCGQIWFSGFCTRTCGLCGSACTDTPRSSESCADAKSWGFCGQSWFNGYCSQTCGVCGGGTGGAPGTGGASATGGTTSTGGAPVTGGVSATGGIAGTGGVSALGGSTSSGGGDSTGGVSGTGGDSSTLVGIDECANGTQRCGGWGGTCTDAIDGYTCTCTAGFVNTGGNHPECQKQGAGLDFARNGLASPTTFSSYDFSTETPSAIGSFSGGDFYINASSAEGKTYFYANNLNQRGVATVWLPGDTQPEPTSLSAIAIPPASEFTQFGRQIVLGGYYVSMARDEYPNYYIIMKVVGFTDTDVLIDWLYVYRG